MAVFSKSVRTLEEANWNSEPDSLQSVLMALGKQHNKKCIRNTERDQPLESDFSSTAWQTAHTTTHLQICIFRVAQVGVNKNNGMKKEDFRHSLSCRHTHRPLRLL